jgi:hypothetical protein
MITRTAIFEGRVRDGRAEDFFAAVEGRLAPLWQAFPHALACASSASMRATMPIVRSR